MERDDGRSDVGDLIDAGGVGEGLSLPATPVVAPEPSKAVITLIFLAFGAFVWFIVGICGYSAVSGLGPRTTEPATITSLDIDSNPSEHSRSTRWVEGRTESGRTWRLASDQAYAEAKRQGLPMAVEVTVSDWTRATLKLRGASVDIDRSGPGQSVGWLIGGTLIAAAALTGAWFRFRKGSVLMGLSYMILSPVWLWLGFIAMRAYRT